jgi:hypothetical protein
MPAACKQNPINENSTQDKRAKAKKKKPPDIQLKCCHRNTEDGLKRENTELKSSSILGYF